MHSPVIQKRLKLSILFTALILVAETVGGVVANSLALLSDAAHMFGDVFSLSLSWFALKIASQPFTDTKTYGYHRMEIFAAFINGVLLLAMAAMIFFEALERFQNPGEVNSLLVLGVATLGLVTNMGVLYFLKDSAMHSHDLNVKSAFFHVVGDALASIAVILGAIVMWVTGWYTLDILLSIAISGLLLFGAWNILSDAVHILLEGVPKGISISEVEKELTSIPAIKNVHELHVWSICSNIYALSTHALVNDQKVQQAEAVLNEAQNLLKEKFNITHSTIQFESSPCQQADALCEMKH